jgi:hypothetical protein
MAQADSEHSTPPTNTSLTRRTVLAGIASAAALPIAALPVAAAAPAAAAQTLDAELIELGARFEPLVDRYITSRKGAGRVLWRKPTPSMIENLAIQQTGTTSIAANDTRHPDVMSEVPWPPEAGQSWEPRA